MLAHCCPPPYGCGGTRLIQLTRSALFSTAYVVPETASQQMVALVPGGIGRPRTALNGQPTIGFRFVKILMHIIPVVAFGSAPPVPSKMLKNQFVALRCGIKIFVRSGTGS